MSRKTHQPHFLNEETGAFEQTDFEFALDQADPGNIEELTALAQSELSVTDRETAEFLRGYIMESRTTPHFID